MFTKESNTNVTNARRNFHNFQAGIVILSQSMNKIDILIHCVTIKQHNRVILQNIRNQFIKVSNIHVQFVDLKSVICITTLGHNITKERSITVILVARNIKVAEVSHSILKLYMKGNVMKHLADTDIPKKETLTKSLNAMLPILTGTNTTTNATDLQYAVIEGVSFGILDGVNSILKVNNNFDTIFMVGGGSKSSFWIELLASLLNSSKIVQMCLRPFERKLRYVLLLLPSFALMVQHLTLMCNCSCILVLIMMIQW